MNPARVVGLLLAAGSGRRFGRPKALLDTGSGPWVVSALEVMAGCDELLVVIGAEAPRVRAVLPDNVETVLNMDHAAGMGSSLALGLTRLAERANDVALVMLVDLPDVTRAVLDRLVDVARSAGEPSAILARASYQGRPGHPVLIGRDHFSGVIDGAVGDSGAREYLSRNRVELIECGDIGGGRDVDSPEQL